jgi:alpha-D-xyloside xylohydrolase
MMLAFPDDPTCLHLDRQYLLGPDLLVAPVFSAAGDVEFYLPAGEWTEFFSGRRESGGRWLREHHGFDSLPLYVREGAVLPLGARADRPDTDHLDGLTLMAFRGAPGRRDVRVGDTAFVVEVSPDTVTATGPVGSWRLQVGNEVVPSSQGTATIRR